MNARLIFAIAFVALATNLSTPRRVAASVARPATIRGVVYRGDKQHPVANADVELVYDHKEDKLGEMILGKTDAKGRYAFSKVEPEGYTISIWIWHHAGEKLPCVYPRARTNDDYSAVYIGEVEGKFAEHILIDRLLLHSGETLVRDLDVTCLDAGK